MGPNGLGNAPQTVFFLRQGAMVGACQTDDAGRFAIKGLTGGVYEVRSSQGGALLCRCWAPQTAPPSATSNLMLSTSSQVVRGQTCFCNGSCSWLKGPLPWIASIVTVVGLVVWDVTEEQHHRFTATIRRRPKTESRCLVDLPCGDTLRPSRRRSESCGHRSHRFCVG